MLVVAKRSPAYLLACFEREIVLYITKKFKLVSTFVFSV